MMTFLEKPRPLAFFGAPGLDLPFDAIEQMKMALRTPVAIAGALLPDAHAGQAMPVGGAISLDRAVSPSLVGTDIGCRVSLTIIDAMDPASINGREQALLQAILSATFFGKKPSAGADHPVMADPAWNEIDILKKIRPEAQAQLGGSGGGNHFADLMTGEVIAEADWLPLAKGDQFVGLMTHSGSRDAGRLAASHFTALAEALLAEKARGVPKKLAWLRTDEDAGGQYLTALRLMGDYAAANHAVIHERFLNRIRGNAKARVEAFHNFAWSRPDGTVIHRKGAIPADAGCPGVIPGSSAGPSYLVEGLGHPDSLWSSSHGAGRRLSRKAAKAAHDPEAAQSAWDAAGVLVRGVSPDEAPFAYKDINHVMSLQEGRLVRTVARMRPLAVVMGGETFYG
jgi:tRNA-splicing ligase RtcB (3'-phosphate/5'-hydroxy nucleic acid ligase)